MFKLKLFLFILLIPLVSATVEVGVIEDGVQGVEIFPRPIAVFNNATANVNSSNITEFLNTNIGPMGDLNTSQFELIGFTLTAIQSYWDGLYCQLTGCTMIGDLSVPSINITGLTEGSIPFIGDGGLLSQDNSKLFWDDTNKRFGVGTNTPASSVHIFEGSKATSLQLESGFGGANIILNKLDNTKNNMIFLQEDGTETYRFGSQGVAAIRDDWVVRETNSDTRLLIEAATGRVGINEIDPISRLHVGGSIFTTGSIDFTQTDKNERISSDLPGTLDLHATSIIDNMIGGVQQMSVVNNGVSFNNGNRDGFIDFATDRILKFGVDTATIIHLDFDEGFIVLDVMSQVLDSKFFQGLASDISLGFNTTDRVVLAEVGSPGAFWEGFSFYDFDNDTSIGGTLTVTEIKLPNNATITDNATCLFLASPDGSTVSEICNV